jgi:hypothetical protein
MAGEGEATDAAAGNWTAYFADGLWDIYVAVLALVFASQLYLPAEWGLAFAGTLFSGLLAFSPELVGWLRRWLLRARLPGGPPAAPVVRRLRLRLGCTFAVALVLGFAALWATGHFVGFSMFAGVRAVPVGPSALVGLLLATVAASAAAVARFWRGLAYAVWHALALLYALWAQSATAFLLAPFVALLLGLILLLQFLKIHPRAAAR